MKFPTFLISALDGSKVVDFMFHLLNLRETVYISTRWKVGLPACMKAGLREVMETASPHNEFPSKIPLAHQCQQPHANFQRKGYDVPFKKN
jgi:hypothetical protein